MTTTQHMSTTELERKVSAVVAGHKMAGFHVDESDREMVRQVLRGELTGDDVAARVRARNAAAADVGR